MLEIKKDTAKKKTYLIYYNGEVINEFIIQVKSIDNKFDNFLMPILNDFYKKYPECGKKLAKILIDWNRYTYLETVFDMLKEYYDLVYECIKKETEYIDVSKFVDVKKKTKNSILVGEDMIRAMIELSYLLKINTILFSTTNCKKELSAKVFNYLVKISNSTKALEELYKIIEKKLSVFKHTDKIMWMFISLYHSKNYETIVNETFNFILNVLFVLFEINQERNIMTFFVSFVEQNIRWLLTDSYTSNITYLSRLVESTDPEHAANAQAITSTIETFLVDTRTDFIKACSYENTIQYIELAVRKYFKKYRVNERDFDVLIERLYTTPLQKYFVLPLISKITGIEYKYLVNNSKIVHYYLQAYLYFLLMELNPDKFHSIVIFLQYGSEVPITENTSSKLKYIMNILSKDLKFFTVYNKTIFIKLVLMLSTVMNRKQKLVNIFNPGNKKIIIPQKFLENAVQFYQDIFTQEDSKLIIKLRKLHQDIISTSNV